MAVRLNWGCGPCIAPGWINSDRLLLPGVDLCCDIRSGLPLATGCVDYIVSIHALQDLSYFDILPTLCEFGRVLKPGGILRLGLPDLEKAICAYMRGDSDYFYISDSEAKSIGSKLVTQVVWYGSVRTPFTFDFIAEWLQHAGFQQVVRCGYKETQSAYADIVRLDNRERESLFVEAATEAA